MIEDSSHYNHHVARYLPAEQLESKLNLSLNEQACTPQQMLDALKEYMHYSPKPWQPDFNKQLYSGFDGAGLLADWVASIANNTMHTYQVAPVATLMEHQLIKQLNRLKKSGQLTGA